MIDVPWLTTELAYVLLLFILFVVPKMLQRYRIPSALTALTFGAIAGMGLNILQTDGTVELLSTLGIVALFLFAGLDVEVSELRRSAVVLTEHVAAQVVLLAGVAAVMIFATPLDWRAGMLVSLALLTPSTGFILDSLAGWGLNVQERFWVRSKAIATELIALAILFVVLQSTSAGRLGTSALALVAMVAALPMVFRWFASAVVPYAPKSEFGFLMMVAVACALVTRSLGVYYLVGAFVVGMAAQQFRKSLPSFATAGMLGAVEAFASLFIPFYFFHAGLLLTPEYFDWRALLVGTAFITVAFPLRLLSVAVHRQLRFGEAWSAGNRVGMSMLPTTVFTFVLVGILRDTFQAPPFLLGGLVVYTIVNTMMPSLFFRAPAPEIGLPQVVEDIEMPAAAPEVFPGRVSESGGPLQN